MVESLIIVLLVPILAGLVSFALSRWIRTRKAQRLMVYTDQGKLILDLTANPTTEEINEAVEEADRAKQPSKSPQITTGSVPRSLGIDIVRLIFVFLVFVIIDDLTLSLNLPRWMFKVLAFVWLPFALGAVWLSLVSIKRHLSAQAHQSSL